MSDATLRWQAQRIEELEAQLADLKRARKRENAHELARLIRAFGVPPQQARIMLCLYRGGGEFVSHGALIDAIYEEGREPGDPDNVLKVQVSKLRRFLPILTQYRIGYALTPEGVARVEHVLKRQQWRAA